MPRVPGEEGKKKEPPAYMGDPNATTQSVHLGASTAPKPANLRKCASRASTPHGGPTEQGLHEVGQAAAELVPAIQAGLADGTLEASDRLAGTLAALLAEVQRARAPRPRAANANIYPDGSVAMEPSTTAVPLRNDMSAASMADAEIITHYGQRFWDAMSARVNAMTYAATTATPTTRRRADEIDAE